jgi:hypothetical protein
LCRYCVSFVCVVQPEGGALTRLVKEEVDEWNSCRARHSVVTVFYHIHACAGSGYDPGGLDWQGYHALLNIASLRVLEERIIPGLEGGIQCVLCDGGKCARFASQLTLWESAQGRAWDATLNRYMLLSDAGGGCDWELVTPPDRPSILADEFPARFLQATRFM